MNKTKSKVLSLILASAMIVSSFSSLNFASAATTRENGRLSVVKDELYLASNATDNGKINIDTLLGGTPDLKTYDNGIATAVEFVSFTHASGDRLVKSIKDNNSDDIDDAVSLAKDAQGKEVITVTYEGEYDRDDKTVKVRGKQDITIYADPVGAQVVGEDGYADNPGNDKPDDYAVASINDADLTFGVYTVGAATNLASTYTAVDATGPKFTVKTASDKAFTNAKDTDVAPSAAGVYTLDTTFADAIVDDPDTTAVDESKPAKYASTGTVSLQATLLTKAGSTEKQTYKFSVAKQWTVKSGAASIINKKGSSTYIGKETTNPDFDNWDNDEKALAVAITGYDVKLADGVASLDVNGGKIGNVIGNAEATVTVDGATTGDIKSYKIDIKDGSAGTLKVKKDDTHTTPSITVDDGKVKAIDAKAASVDVNGGTVSGDVVGATVSIDSSDEDVATTINGNVTAKADPATVEISSSSDAAVKVTGTVKGAVTLTDEYVTVGTIDADYENDLTFDGFTGKISSIINTADVNIDVVGETVLALNGKLEAGSLDIEDEDGKVTIGEGNFNSVSGDGTLAVPAGKLFIEDSMEDITLQLTSGLTAGATAFTAYSDAVDVEDFTALGYTLEQKAVNSDVDKFVIKSVTFAGVQFDKTELSIAKDQSSTLTVSAYPTGTALPAGASIEWDIDANDDYITMTTEGNVATIKVVDFNDDYATDNQATITATVVDANGNTYDDYVAATAKVTATALPTSIVTLDTTKPVTVGTNAVYQYIAKSSTGAVMSAASSDTQIATVELFNAADPRGYKFQIKGLAEGTATITTTDANGATATLTVNVTKVEGTLKADTTTYTFAPGAIYDVKFSTTGTTAVPVVTVNGKVVSIAPRGNGVYRVTAQNAGTAFVVATVGNTHVSVKFVVAPGAVKAGVTGNNVSILK
ncbi:hypothetical protein [Faecalispora jeddahensis]|uniref:hypothetical protein n=1 Tax=Faecalispora jeddahensis TaxID=1414721 RepID=UPI0028AF237A|nr:hypothetical protein [Faecalispora jeddahensis]